MTPLHCARCATELAPGMLACPACGWLVHGEILKRLAADAERATADDPIKARERWNAALQLLPADAQQHELVRARIAELSERASVETGRPAGAPDGRWWSRGLPALASVGVLALGKLKFLALGLTKASTFVSMFAFFGVYWSIYGWPLALGVVVAIYIHEMGHVSMLRTLGIEAGAPLFIPGVGAMVMLKQQVTDPLTDARIGLAGPAWGLAAALAAAGVYAITRQPVWLAIAEVTGFLNLFNLIPVWQLDGSRGFHALSHWERWAVTAAVLVALAWTEQRLLLIIGAVAAWRALQSEAGPGNTRILATYVGLVFALAWLARGIG